MSHCHGDCGSCQHRRRGTCRTIIWRFQSEYRYKVYLEFYSQDRDGHAWPGGGEVYVLSDGREHRFHIEGLGGETVCYGAWEAGDSSVYWGAGKNGVHGCRGCCYPCEGVTTRLIRLMG